MMGPNGTPIPRDEALPQMAQLLDPEAMAGILSRSLGAGTPPVRVDIPYNRYKPRDSLVVHYRVDVGGAQHDAVAISSAADDLSGEPETPQHRARAELVAGRAPASVPFFFEPQVRALVQWLPFDLDLGALSERPPELRRRLAHAGLDLPAGDGEPLLLQYRPRRRVALRLGRHVVKIYRNRPDFDAGVAGLDASARVAGIRTARRQAVVPEWFLTVQELVAGDPIPRRAEAAAEAGALLAELHASGLTGLKPLLPAHRLKQVAGAVKVVAAVSPQLESRASRLLRELERTAPDVHELVPSHGDFHGGQLLAQADGFALIDFDLLGAAPAAYDVSNYAGHLVPRDAPDIATAAAVLDRVVEGYGSRPPWLSWYLAASILRRARVPFRNFEPDWPAGVEVMVGAAEAAFRL